MRYCDDTLKPCEYLIGHAGGGMRLLDNIIRHSDAIIRYSDVTIWNRGYVTGHTDGITSHHDNATGCRRHNRKQFHCSRVQ